MSKRSRYKIETKNRFAPLTEPEEEQDDHDMDTDEGENTEEEDNTQESKKKKPPPMVLHGKIKDHETFVKLIKQISVENKFHIKYHEENVEVFLYNKKDYDNLTKVWKDKSVKFHTYTPKDEKEELMYSKDCTNKSNWRKLKKT